MNTFRNGLRLKLSVLAVVMLVAALIGPTSALAAAETYTENVKVPIDLVVFVPCAAGGAGEEVYFSGPLHILLHFTIDNRGGFHAKTHFQPQGVSGVGQTTGAKYQATGVTQDHFNGKVGVTYTFVNNFKIIGQGPGNNFLVHENYHVTINANGTVVVEHDNFSVVCK